MPDTVLTAFVHVRSEPILLLGQVLRAVFVRLGQRRAADGGARAGGRLCV